MLEGDNAYHCEKCDKKVHFYLKNKIKNFKKKKVSAKKRMCLKRLPNHLILVLKRFEFNFDTMQKMKINEFCEFPDEIDFFEFS